MRESAACDEYVGPARALKEFTSLQPRGLRLHLFIDLRVNLQFNHLT